MARRGAQKAQQFVAHEGQVNCLKIGRQSVGVLVTGGDDAKVNLWTIGKPAAILSLAGHSTAVTSVTFDTSEQRVLAGSQGGTLKVWDIEESKVLATMSGHRTAVQVVDFHPFSSYFASGSQDTNVKLWDWRQRGCVCMFKGHKRAVSCLVYSPDGKWIVSGGDDSVVKIWDTTAGKLLHEFTEHTAPITAIQFNPCELVLASASADKCVRFWDLETFEPISTCGPETTPPRAIAFMPDGNCLLAAYSDGLRVYDFDPAATFDFVDAAWSRVCDLAVLTGDRRLPGCSLTASAGDQNVLGCSLNANSVGVWIYPVSKINVPPPVLDSGAGPAAAGAAPSSGSQPGAERPSNGSASGGGGAAQPPRAGIGRSPGAALQRVLAANSSVQQALASVEPSVPQSPPVGGGRASSSEAAPRSAPARRATADSATAPDRSGSAARPPATAPAPSGRLSSGANVPFASSSGSAAAPASISGVSDRRSRARQQSAPGDAAAARAAPPSQALLDAGTDAPGDSLQRFSRPFSGERRSAPSVSPGPDAAPSITRTTASAQTSSSDAFSADDFQAAMHSGHDRFVAAVSARHSSLSLARLAWQRGDSKGVLNTLSRCGDPAVVADVLQEAVHRMEAFTLDSCVDAVPAVEECLKSVSDMHKRSALAFCLALLTCFAAVIRDAAQQRALLGVDLSGEARRNRCLAAKAALEGLQPLLEKCLARPPTIAMDAERLLNDIKLLGTRSAA